jgi:curved DNA-binding protein CbpA
MALAQPHDAAAERVPRVPAGIDPTALSLTPAEGYLLSRIDGRTSWRELRQIGGASAAEVDRCLERWLADGVVELAGGAGPRRVEPRPAAPDAPPPPPVAEAVPPAAATAALGAARPVLDPALDLPAALQQKLIDLYARLDAPYHEILGVPADADRKALKRAYFALSKEFHPDRYFRKQLGGFQQPLERVFRKIVEAYELLSDPTARAEIERSLAAANPQAEPAAAPRAASTPAESIPQAAPAPPRAPRRRHVFTLAERMRKERKQRAKRLFEAGMAAFAAERWLEAAGGVRLAIAFDPWNAAYKEQFADVQRKAHDETARKLIREAENALDLRDFPTAVRAFEEALQYRPGDVALLRRAAQLAVQTGGDLHQAKEWALEAVELEPGDAGGHRLLGQVYQAAGLAANARRELEAALQLDPGNDEVRAELRELSGGSSPLRWLGGKR